MNIDRTIMNEICISIASILANPDEFQPGLDFLMDVLVMTS